MGSEEVVNLLKYQLLMTWHGIVGKRDSEHTVGYVHFWYWLNKIMFM